MELTMIKHFLGSMAFVAILTTQVCAQATFATDKGSIILTGSATFYAESGELTGDETRTSLGVSGGVMFFVSPNFAVGGSLGGRNTSWGGDTDTYILVGPSVGYWWGGPGQKSVPFATAALQYSTLSDVVKETEVILTGGVDVFVAKNVAFTFGGRFRLEFMSYESSDETVTGNTIAGIAALRLFAF
jgi:hypothetical protein